MTPKWREVQIKQRSGRLYEHHFCFAKCEEKCSREVWVEIGKEPPKNCEEVERENLPHYAVRPS